MSLAAFGITKIGLRNTDRCLNWSSVANKKGSVWSRSRAGSRVTSRKEADVGLEGAV